MEYTLSADREVFSNIRQITLLIGCCLLCSLLYMYFSLIWTVECEQRRTQPIRGEDSQRWTNQKLQNCHLKVQCKCNDNTATDKKALYGTMKRMRSLNFWSIFIMSGSHILKVSSEIIRFNISLEPCFKGEVEERWQKLCWRGLN